MLFDQSDDFPFIFTSTVSHSMSPKKETNESQENQNFKNGAAMTLPISNKTNEENKRETTKKVPNTEKVKKLKNVIEIDEDFFEEYNLTPKSKNKKPSNSVNYEKNDSLDLGNIISPKAKTMNNRNVPIEKQIFDAINSKKQKKEHKRRRKNMEQQKIIQQEQLRLEQKKRELFEQKEKLIKEKLRKALENDQKLFEEERKKQLEERKRNDDDNNSSDEENAQPFELISPPRVIKKTPVIENILNRNPQQQINEVAGSKQKIQQPELISSSELLESEDNPLLGSNILDSYEELGSTEEELIRYLIENPIIFKRIQKKLQKKESKNNTKPLILKNNDLQQRNTTENIRTNKNSNDKINLERPTSTNNSQIQSEQYNNNSRFRGQNIQSFKHQKSYNTPENLFKYSHKENQNPPNIFFKKKPSSNSISQYQNEYDPLQKYMQQNSKYPQTTKMNQRNGFEDSSEEEKDKHNRNYNKNPNIMKKGSLNVDKYENNNYIPKQYKSESSENYSKYPKHNYKQNKSYNNVDNFSSENSEEEKYQINDFYNHIKNTPSDIKSSHKNRNSKLNSEQFNILNDSQQNKTLPQRQNNTPKVRFNKSKTNSENYLPYREKEQFIQIEDNAEYSSSNDDAMTNKRHKHNRKQFNFDSSSYSSDSGFAENEREAWVIIDKIIKKMRQKSRYFNEIYTRAEEDLEKEKNMDPALKAKKMQSFVIFDAEQYRKQKDMTKTLVTPRKQVHSLDIDNHANTAPPNRIYRGSHNYTNNDTEDSRRVSNYSYTDIQSFDDP